MVVALVASCKKERDSIIEPQNKEATVNIKFDYVFGHNLLPWENYKEMVHPMTGDTLSFETFKFYVSNIKLKKADGSYWVDENSYYLVCTNCDEGRYITLDNVPVGEYIAMEYTMGVDSIMNVNGVHTGDLSLSNGMYWNWNSGYIMLKAEGRSPNSPTGTFAFHLGGFSGSDNIITIKTADFGASMLKVSTEEQANIILRANPARLWHGSPSVSVRSTIHAPGPEAKKMADEFYGNVSFTGIKYE